MHHVQVATVNDRNWDLGVVGSGSEDTLAFVPMDAQHNAQSQSCLVMHTYSKLSFADPPCIHSVLEIQVMVSKSVLATHIPLLYAQ